MLEQLQKENSTNLEMLLQDRSHRDSMLVAITDFILFLRSGTLEEENEKLLYYLQRMAQSESYSFSQNYLLR
jgi:hypothetical protein